MKSFVLALCLFSLGGGLRAQSVETVLARMDQSSPGFRAMTAEVRMLTYTAILDDRTIENGTLEMQRLNHSDVRAILDFSGQTDARVIAFLGRIVRIYYPKLKEYQDYEIGKNSGIINQYLLLGFGSSGTELAQSYTIVSEGPEKIAGEEATRLQLVPKDPKVRERLTKVEMWIPNDAAYPVQQQFYEPSGNYRKVTYSNIKINPPIRGALELKLPHGAKRQASE